MVRNLALLALIYTAAACSSATSGSAAQAPEPEPVFNPAGVYDITFEIQGQTDTGTLEITGGPGAFSGTVSSSEGTLPIENVALEGMVMTFSVETPNGMVSFQITFSGDSFSGEWDFQGFTGPINGEKRSS